MIHDKNNRSSAVMKAPNEILSEIFLHSCPRINDHSSAASISPLTLSHVCRLWRSVSFNSPQLWSYADLVAPRRSLTSLKEMLKIWAANTKTCPLTINVGLKGFAQYKKPDDVLPFVREITSVVAEVKPSASRAETPLTVSITPQSYPYSNERFDWGSKSLAPAVEPHDTVSLHVTTRPCLLYGMSLHSTFGPYLVNLDLRDFEESMELDLEAAQDIMKTYPRLRHLALRLGEVLHPIDEVREANDTYELRDLEGLCLSWNDGAQPEQFLHSIHATSLSHLELDGYAEANDPVWSALFENLRRTHPPLRALDLYRIDCAGADLANVSNICRGLEQLWISDATIDVPSIRESLLLTGAGSNPSGASSHYLFKSLRTLGLVRCEMQGISYLSISLMLSERVWTETHLEGLYVADCGLSVRNGSGYAGMNTPGAFHLLRSKWEAGEYADIGTKLQMNVQSDQNKRASVGPDWVRRLYFSFHA